MLNPINGVNFPNDNGDFRISFSRYVLWRKCQLAFKLEQIDKIGEQFEGNIYTIFGSIIGDYIEKLFAKELPEIGIGRKFMIEFESACLAKKDIINSHPKLKYSNKLVTEFTNQGLLILNAIRKKIKSPAWKKWKFIAYEHKLYEYIPEEIVKGIFDDRKYLLNEETQLLDIENPNLGKRPYFHGYIDLLLEDENGKKIIIDFKTASKPWDAEAKRDMNKKAQLKLYKYFYHQQSGIPLDDIRTMFIVLPRTQTKRYYQEIEESFGKLAIANELKKLQQFFQNVYKNKIYLPVLKEDVCKWCQFKATKHCKNS